MLEKQTERDRESGDSKLNGQFYFSLYSSVAKGSSTTGEELDSPHGQHGAEMADLYAGMPLGLHEPGSASMESLDSGSQTLKDLIGSDLDDPALRLLDEEPPQWSATVDKKVMSA